MIRIAITSAAFEAIAATLPLGSVDFEPAVEEGESALYLVGGAVARPAKELSRARRELQRRHPAAGGEGG
jgi:hypothetical protein